MAKKPTSRSKRPAKGGRAKARSRQEGKGREGTPKPGLTGPASNPGKKSFKKKGASGTDKSQKMVQKPKIKVSDGSMRLNRYISNSGVCSRREADTLIEAGVVTVNGEIITEMGIKVMPGDVVKIEGDTLSQEKKRYVILNKPKNFITSMDDPQGRRTVMQLVKNATKERIYPVGRLDRNTTGLLLFTNDGDMAKKLTHPAHNVRKIYHVTTDHKVKINHIHALREGIELEDGFIKADEVDYVGNGEDARQVGIEIHSGKNRIVRRMFEYFGYDVVKLDRVTFAGLTKKDLPRGKWRFLTEQEIGFLNMI